MYVMIMMTMTSRRVYEDINNEFYYSEKKILIMNSRITQPHISITRKNNTNIDGAYRESKKLNFWILTPNALLNAFYYVLRLPGEPLIKR